MINLAPLLSLVRPLAVLDLESTGLNPDLDHIVQIGLTIHYPTKPPVPWVTLVNPGVPVPAEATSIHHITDEMVKDAPLFRHFADGLAKHLTNVDYVGYGVYFDLKLLRMEMRRAKVAWNWETTDSRVIDALSIYRRLKPHDLASAYREYVDPAGFEGAHDAGRDVAATEAVIVGQLGAYPNDVPRTVAALADYCFPVRPGYVDKAGKLMWRNGEACLAFGRWTGKPLREVDKGYLEWMLTSDFPADTKAVLRTALAGEYPKRGA